MDKDLSARRSKVSIGLLAPADVLGAPDDFPDLRLHKRVPKAVKALFSRLCEPPG